MKFLLSKPAYEDEKKVKFLSSICVASKVCYYGIIFEIIPETIDNLSKRQINKVFRYTEAYKYAQMAFRYNPRPPAVVERAIRRLRDKEHQGLIINEGLEYYEALEAEITNIVNAQF